jgi:hypothetical protein
MIVRPTLHCSGAGRSGLTRLAALALAFAIPLAATAGYPGAAHAQPASAANAPAGKSNMTEKAPASRKLDPNVLFTEQERESWKQKIAAAPDEAERRKLRGQRLAELQRRNRAAKAASADQAAPAASGQRTTGPARGDMTRTAGTRSQAGDPR